MIIGHERNIRILEKLLASSNPIHGFLFWGPDGIGKKRIAIEFSRALLCAKKTMGGCGSCISCDEFNRLGSHRDFLIAEPSVEGGAIPIEEARGIIAFLASMPVLSGRKVVLIDNAERLTEEAQHALLKTAEEPPPAAILIFVSSQPGKLFETIRSRLVSLPFQPVPDKLMRTIPDLIDLDPRERDALIGLTLGKPGRAIALAKDPSRRKRALSMLDEARTVTDRSIPDRMLLAKHIVEDDGFQEFFTVWLAHFGNAIHGAKYIGALGRAANNARAILAATMLFEDTNVNRRILVENLMLSLK